MPVARHLMFQNFSKPMSEANPLSVTRISPRRLARRSAITELWPIAMLANGPAWTKTGWPSSVCMSVGFTARTIHAVIAPSTSRSRAVTGVPERDHATTMRPMRSRRSARSRETARMAISPSAC